MIRGSHVRGGDALVGVEVSKDMVEAADLRVPPLVCALVVVLLHEVKILQLLQYLHGMGYILIIKV